MNILQILLDKTENHYNVHKICKLWSNRYRLGIEEMCIRDRTSTRRV